MGRNRGGEGGEKWGGEGEAATGRGEREGVGGRWYGGVAEHTLPRASLTIFDRYLGNIRLPRGGVIMPS